MSDELQFTEEEIDHAVRAFTQEIGYTTVAAPEIVRAVLRAVRAVPARCLNGSLPGHPATVGTFVQGQGTGGVLVRGVVEASYPVTTTVRTPDGRIDYLWTNTIHSWDPSTDKPSTPATLSGSPLGLATGKIWLSGATDEYLRADDDGMAVEADR